MKVHVEAVSKSAAITIIAITVVTIWAELSKPLKDSLASITGHHWVTKSAGSIIAFLVLYSMISLSTKDNFNPKRDTLMVVALTILGSLAISIFYVWHFLSG